MMRSRFTVLNTAPPDNQNGLILWFPFDDGKATDFSGNQNNGIATGTPVFAPSEVGNSYGTSSGNYFSVPTAYRGSDNPITTQRVTVAAWLKPNVLSRSDAVAVWGNNGSGTDQFVLLHGLTSGKPQFFVNNGGPVGTGTGALTFVVGRWYHVAGTFDGTTISVWVNGAVQSTGPAAGISGSGATNPIHIGSMSGTTNPFNGSLADVRVYNRALSAVEINALYHRGVQRMAIPADEWELPALFTAGGGGGGGFIPAWAMNSNLPVLGTGTY
jgi:hypothetical protein